MSSVRAALLFTLFLVGACSGEPAAPPAAPPVTVPPPASETTLEPQLEFAVTDEEGFTRRGPPQPGEWLAQHEERGQTYEDYITEDPVRATGTRKVLAFMPVGDFGADEWRAAEAAMEFAGIWFDVGTRVLERADLARPDDWYRERTTPAGTPIRQYRTGWFLRRLLPRHLPDDAVCLVGVTMADLYPGPDWNYVFGEADLRRRVGVYSLVRYFPEFWGEADTAAARTLALRRTLKLVVHEVGHTFGIEHCTFFECNMAGSNSLGESDRSPLHLCPVCLRKLHWNRGFDLLARYRRLLAYFREHDLGDEAEWTARRIARIEAR